MNFVARKSITPMLTTSVPVVRKILDAAAGSAPNFLRVTGTNALALALIILVSMMASCVVSGLMGAYVPVFLKKCGADPAAASSIFLTTGTDVVSMGVMLFLATKFIINT